MLIAWADSVKVAAVRHLSAEQDVLSGQSSGGEAVDDLASLTAATGGVFYGNNRVLSTAHTGGMLYGVLCECSTNGTVIRFLLYSVFEDLLLTSLFFR